MVLSSRSVPLDVAPRFQVNRTVALASAVSLNAAALLLLSLMGDGAGLAPETAKRHVIIADWIVPRPVIPPPPVPPAPVVKRNVTQPTVAPAPSVVAPAPVLVESSPLQAIEGASSVEAGVDQSAALDRSAPAYDIAPRPRYPQLALRNGWEGTVMLDVLVGVDGRVEQIRVQRGSGHRVLDQQALRQVREAWRFHPALREGRPVAAWASVPVEFRIDQ
jgi:protein TonB